MCIILALDSKEELSKITLKILKSAELTNPHGNGYATLKNGKVIFEKGVTMELIWEKIQSGEIVAPCVIHARITSVGETMPELTHPFIISENTENKMSGTLESNESAFFHNGTYSDFKQLMLQTALGSGRKLPSGSMSDSRGLAFCLHTLGIQALEYLDTTDKFAILDRDGLKKFGRWYDVAGVQSSNNYYGESTFEYGSFPKNNYWIDDEVADALNDEDNRFYKTPEYDYSAAQKEITEFQADKKPTKAQHKKNLKYLKLHGWENIRGSLKKLSKRNAAKAVESMVRQNKIIESIQDAKSKKKDFEDSWSMEDYQDCYSHT
jgi:predicted glutamine amidotransferase